MSELYFSNDRVKLYRGDVLDGLRHLSDESIQTVVTSPPYWGLRDYGAEGQLGLERTPEEYVERIVKIFREVRRVLKADGTLWLNLGDSYAGGGRGGGGSYMAERKDDSWQSRGNATGYRSTPPGLKPKDLVGIPWRVAFALQADGWYLRQDIIWAKPNPMPESVTDRCTKSHEYIFLLTKSAKYHYDAEAIRSRAKEASIQRLGQNIDGQIGSERAHAGCKKNGAMKAVGVVEGVNRRSVWTIATQGYPGAHFATFPKKLIQPCIKAGARPGDLVLDPFAGSGTTLEVAIDNGCRSVGIEINPKYCELIVNRLAQGVFSFGVD